MTAHRYKMKDLCEKTGLSRQAIYFYVQQGLLPPGEKTSRNMAWYTEAHVERLILIRRLQHERFLPLRAIRALLDEQDERLSVPQHQFLRELRGHLRLNSPGEAAKPEPGLARHVTEEERLELIALGAIRGRVADGVAEVIAEDQPLLDIIGAIRAAGFAKEDGFSPKDLDIFARAVADLVKSEVGIIAHRLERFGPTEAAARIERVLPHVHALIVHYHQSRIRDVLSSL